MGGGLKISVPVCFGARRVLRSISIRIDLRMTILYAMGPLDLGLIESKTEVVWGCRKKGGLLSIQTVEAVNP